MYVVYHNFEIWRGGGDPLAIDTDFWGPVYHSVWMIPGTYDDNGDEIFRLY